MPWNSVRATLERLKAEAIAELDAKDADECYITRPNDSFTPPKGFDYKHPVLCAAHVHGIADPAMYGNHRSREVASGAPKQPKLMQDKEKRDKLKDDIIAIQADRRNALDSEQSFEPIARHAISRPPRMPNGPMFALPRPAPTW